MIFIKVIVVNERDLPNLEDRASPMQRRASRPSRPPFSKNPSESWASVIHKPRICNFPRRSPGRKLQRCNHCLHRRADISSNILCWNSLLMHSNFTLSRYIEREKAYLSFAMYDAKHQQKLEIAKLNYLYKH